MNPPTFRTFNYDRDTLRHEVAAVKLELFDLCSRDNVRNSRCLGLNSRNVSGDSDFLRHLAERHLHVDALNLTHLQRDPRAHELLEALRLCTDHVVPDR